jgi:ABC-type nitrate/sulfonate/bicarbonate transport system substrate-binding protein
MKLTRRTFITSAAAMATIVAKPAILRAAEPLMFGFLPGNSIHWIADVLVEKGFLKDVGFDLQFSTMQSSPQSIQWAVAGAYQIAASQPEPFIAAVERGADSLAAISAPMNRADWVLNGAPGITSVKDLKGKTIGVSALRNSEVWLTTQLLEKAGLNKGEYDFIVAGTSPAKVIALQKGAIAAAVMFQPSAELAITQGLAALAYYGNLRAYPPTLYVVNKEWAAKGDAGKRVAHALGRGHAWLWDPNNRAEATQILSKYTKREQPIVDAVYEDYFVKGKIYSKAGEIELDGLNRALADMASDGELIKVPAPPATKYVLDRSLGGLAR